jgi:hypothetical protein
MKVIKCANLDPVPNSNLGKYQTGVYYSGIMFFSNLPPNIRSLNHDIKKTIEGVCPMSLLPLCRTIYLYQNCRTIYLYQNFSAIINSCKLNGGGFLL